MKTLRRIVTLAIIIACVWVGLEKRSAVWMWATTRVEYHKPATPPLHGFGFVTRMRVPRWGSSSTPVAHTTWLTGSGMVVSQKLPEDRITDWNLAGEIVQQQEGSVLVRSEPPWLWGRTDHLTSDAPWVEEGRTFEEWWKTIPDDRRVGDWNPRP